MLRSLPLLVILLAVIPQLSADQNCTSSHNIHTYCGFQGPEDLVHVPDTSFLIVSQYGGHIDRRPSDLVSFNIDTQAKKLILPKHPSEYPSYPLWGQETCTTPPLYYSPHGIDLSRRPDGDLMLLVVNHAELDSVQFFKVLKEDLTLSLEWRGCVIMSEDIKLNDVAALPNGGFVIPALKVRSLQSEPEYSPEINLLRWSEDTGLQTVLSPQTGYGNGIAVTNDGDFVFINDTLGSRVMKVSLVENKLIAETPLASPDNSSWSNEGQLIVVSILFNSPEDLERCDQNKKGPCDIAFMVTSLDPETMSKKILFRHDGSKYFGGTTVAVQVGDALYLGSAFGDRIAKIMMPKEKVLK